MCCVMHTYKCMLYAILVTAVDQLVTKPVIRRLLDEAAKIHVWQFRIEMRNYSAFNVLSYSNFNIHLRFSCCTL